jgi:hypothetical protein
VNINCFNPDPFIKAPKNAFVHFPNDFESSTKNEEINEMVALKQF